MSGVFLHSGLTIYCSSENNRQKPPDLSNKWTDTREFYETPPVRCVNRAISPMELTFPFKKSPSLLTNVSFIIIDLFHINIDLLHINVDLPRLIIDLSFLIIDLKQINDDLSPVLEDI